MQAKIVRNFLVLLLSAPKLHQGVDRRVKIPQKVKGHRISCAQPKLPTAITSLYMYVGMFSYHDNYSFFWPSSWIGSSQKECCFYFSADSLWSQFLLLGADYFSADHRWMNLWKGYYWFKSYGWNTTSHVTCYGVKTLSTRISPKILSISIIYVIDSLHPVLQFLIESFIKANIHINLW